MLSVSSRIWTRVAVSISHDDKHYTTGTSGYVTVSKLDEQTFTGEFDSHCELHPYDLVPHLSKNISKLLNY